jgi:hypothetical protein
MWMHSIEIGKVAPMLLVQELMRYYFYYYALIHWRH